MPHWTRAILHVDMDAFFASVEQLDRPELRGRPVLVGGDGLRGVVSAASYESRAFGCRSAMPMAVAKRLCPHAVVVRGSFARYSELSGQIFDILHRFTPLVQPVSVDEAFCDVTATQPHFGPAEAIAAEIRRVVKAETGLTASVGVAPNKFLAKLASDLDKPDGLTVIRPEDVDRVLPPLDVGRIWGIGPKTVERLHGWGVRTVGDLRKMPDSFFDKRFGVLGGRVRRLIRGEDDRPVHSDREAKSIGQERTFGVDLTDPDAVRGVLLGETECVAERLRRGGLTAGAVTVKIRFGDFRTITRRHTLPERTDATADVWRAAADLFDVWAAVGFRPVRLIGVACAALGRQTQMPLFADPSRQRQTAIDCALDSIRQKYGPSSIGRAAAATRRRD